MEWGKDYFIPAWCALGMKRPKAAQIPSFSKLFRAIYIYKNNLFLFDAMYCEDRRGQGGDTIVWSLNFSRKNGPGEIVPASLNVT